MPRSLPVPTTATRRGSHRSDRPGEATWLDGHHRVQEHGGAGGLLPGRSQGAPKAAESLKSVMALITRRAGRDGPTRGPCESLDRQVGPWGAWLTEAG